MLRRPNSLNRLLVPVREALPTTRVGMFSSRRLSVRRRFDGVQSFFPFHAFALVEEIVGAGFFDRLFFADLREGFFGAERDVGVFALPPEVQSVVSGVLQVEAVVRDRFSSACFQASRCLPPTSISSISLSV